MSTTRENKEETKWNTQANWSNMIFGGPYPRSCSTATKHSVKIILAMVSQPLKKISNWEK